MARSIPPDKHMGTWRVKRLAWDTTAPPYLHSPGTHRWYIPCIVRKDWRVATTFHFISSPVPRCFYAAHTGMLIESLLITFEAPEVTSLKVNAVAVAVVAAAAAAVGIWDAETISEEDNWGVTRRRGGGGVVESLVCLSEYWIKILCSRGYEEERCP